MEKYSLEASSTDKSKDEGPYPSRPKHIAVSRPKQQDTDRSLTSQDDPLCHLNKLVELGQGSIHITPNPNPDPNAAGVLKSALLNEQIILPPRGVNYTQYKRVVEKIANSS